MPRASTWASDLIASNAGPIGGTDAHAISAFATKRAAANQLSVARRRTDARLAALASKPALARARLADALATALAAAALENVAAMLGGCAIDATPSGLARTMPRREAAPMRGIAALWAARLAAVRALPAWVTRALDRQAMSARLGRRAG